VKEGGIRGDEEAPREGAVIVPPGTIPVHCAVARAPAHALCASATKVTVTRRGVLARSDTDHAPSVCAERSQRVAPPLAPHPRGQLDPQRGGRPQIRPGCDRRSETSPSPIPLARRDIGALTEQVGTGAHAAAAQPFTQSGAEAG
jgi:hypothetical protein